MGRLIDVNKWFKDIFPKADLDYPILDNKKAYPHWSIDITGLADILNDAESVEAIPKANVYKAIQEMMKYEHEGFINISLTRLDEILKKCEVSEDGKID